MFSPERERGPGVMPAPSREEDPEVVPQKPNSPEKDPSRPDPFFVPKKEPAIKPAKD